MSDNNTTSSNNNTTFGVIPAEGFIVKSAMSLIPPYTVYLTSVAGNRAIEFSSDAVSYAASDSQNTATNTITAGVDYKVRTIRVTGTPGDKWGTL